MLISKLFLKLFQNCVYLELDSEFVR